MKNLRFKLTLLIVASCFVAISNIHAQIDLELSLQKSVAEPAIWSNFTVTATIENKGAVTAQNVRVSIPNPSGLKSQGGFEFSTNAGFFVLTMWIVHPIMGRLRM